MLRLTRSALTMLLAHYRSVLKNTGFKTAATAAAVTAALSLTSAQAAQWPASGSEVIDGTVTVDTAGEAGTAAIVGVDDVLNVSGSSAVTITDQNADAGVTVSGGAFNVTGGAGAGADTSVALGKGTYIESGSVTVSAADGSNNTSAKLMGGVNVGSEFPAEGAAAVLNITNTAGTGTATAGDSGAEAQDVINLYSNGTINLKAASEAQHAVLTGKTFNMYGGKLDVTNGTLAALQANISDGEIAVANELAVSGSVILDAAAKLTNTAGSDSKVNLTAETSKLSLTNEQLAAYLAGDGVNKGQLVVTESKAVLAVDGSMDLTDQDLVAASAGAAGKIATAGRVEIKGDLNVASVQDKGSMAFGGVIAADKITLNNKNDIGDYEEFKVKSGLFEAASGFGGNSAIVFGSSSSDAGLTLTQGGTITSNIELDGKTLGDADLAQGTFLNIKGGVWTAENRTFTLSKGLMNVAEGASLDIDEIVFDDRAENGEAQLNIAGTVNVNDLTAYKANQVTVKGGDLTVKSLDLGGAAAGTVAVTTAGTVSTSAENVLSSAAAVSKDYRQGAVSLDGTSTLVLTDAADVIKNQTTLTGAEFAAVRELVIGNSSQGMLSLEGIGADVSADLNADGVSMSYDKASQYNGWADALSQVQVQGVNEEQQQKSVSWGSVQLDTAQAALNIGDQGSISLSNAVDGKFVQTAAGELTGAALNADNAQLALKGAGKIGSITSGADNYGEVILDGRIETAGTIGEQTKAVRLLSLKSGADVSAGYVNVNSLEADGAVLRAEETTDLEVNKALSDAGVLGSMAFSGKLTNSQVWAENGITIGTAGAELIGGVMDAGRTLTLNGDLFAAGSTAAEPEAEAEALAARMGEALVEASSEIDVQTDSLSEDSVLIPEGTSLPQVSAYAAVLMDSIDPVTKTVGAGAGSMLYVGEDRTADEVLAMAQAHQGAAGALLDRAVTVQGGHLVVDSTYTSKDQLDEAVTSGTVASVQLGADDDLVITASALDGGAAVTADGAADLQGTVRLHGLALKNGRTYYVFNAAGGIKQGADVAYEIDSQLFRASAAADGTVAVAYDTDGKAAAALAETDSSIRSMINAYGENGGEFYSDGSNGVSFVTAVSALTTADKHGNTVPNAELIGKTLNSAASITSLGGAPQVTFMAQDSSVEALRQRMGYAAAQNANLVELDGTKGGLWALPVYKHQDSDDFDAAGMSYGVNADLYGLVVGADFTPIKGLKAGLLFNIGQGDAESQGDGTATSNDFNYLGLSLYGGYTFGQAAILSDLSFVQADHDIDQSTPVGGLSTSFDTYSFSLGVEGRYTFKFKSLDITPHLGLRYSSFNTDDYGVSWNGGKAVNGSSYDANVFTMPFGVTFAANFKHKGWLLKPATDLFFVPAFGDLDVDQDVYFTGIGSNASVSADIMDSFSYGIKLGLDAQFKHFGLGIGYGFMGSSAGENHSVMGNLRYEF